MTSKSKVKTISDSFKEIATSQAGQMIYSIYRVKIAIMILVLLTYVHVSVKKYRR